MPTYTTTIELEVDIEYDVTPASRGHRDSLGVPEEPDEDASLEVSSVKVSTGAKTPPLEIISACDVTALEDEILDSLEEV